MNKTLAIRPIGRDADRESAHTGSDHGTSLTSGRSSSSFFGRAARAFGKFLLVAKLLPGCGDSGNPSFDLAKDAKAADSATTEDGARVSDGANPESDGGAVSDDMDPASDDMSDDMAAGEDMPEADLSANPADLVMVFDGARYMMPSHPVTCEQIPDQIIYLTKGKPSKPFDIAFGSGAGSFALPINMNNQTTVYQIGHLAVDLAGLPAFKSVLAALETGVGMCLQVNGTEVSLAKGQSAKVPLEQYTLTITLVNITGTLDKNGANLTATVVIQAD
ncbi:hypothetical protein HY988_00270 [Candidatus Micrarchaeota archaeon]|nr:hypothetical protein [Candidatus Micrarchaeota archaeon]